MLARTAVASFALAVAGHGHAAPSVLDPDLQVQTVVGGLTAPAAMAFIGPDDVLVLERLSGRVQRVSGGVVQGTVLDLAVNRFSERGLRGIALDPNFASNGRVYLSWTESLTGADSGGASEVSLLANRVDRFVWNGSTLTQDLNLGRFRAVQADAGDPARGNNNGGSLAFGPDGKLYVGIGDVGRRGWLQNLPEGPRPLDPPPRFDDQFGGPAPDDAHLTGVILRLNPDGSAPADNPFFAAGASLGGQVGANVQGIYAYGLRTASGLAFDPLGGGLWTADRGDDAFDELNRVFGGMNGGWVQAMGPISRVAEYESIETTPPYTGLQQSRWNPTDIAADPAAALAAMFMLPGASYSDPEFAWRYAVAPGSIGFLAGAGLGSGYAGDLFVGGATDLLEDGYLFRFDLNAGRTGFEFGAPGLQDLVADNATRFDLTGSESLLFGRGFGALTDIETGPDGSLYVVSATHGTIYRIAASDPPSTDVPAPATWLLVAAPMVAWWGVRRRGVRRSS